MTVIWEDGDELIDRKSFDPKNVDGYPGLGDLTPVLVDAHDGQLLQYIALRQNGNRIFIDERQVMEIIKWLGEIGCILGGSE
jgi:hypothetical protein